MNPRPAQPPPPKAARRIDPSAAMIACTAVVLPFGPYLANLSRPANRYEWMWSRQDAIGLCVLLAVLAFMLWGGNALLRRCGRDTLQQCRSAGLTAAVLLGLLININYMLDRPALLDRFGWLIACTGGLAALTTLGAFLARAARTLALCLAPAALLLMVTPMFLSAFPVDPPGTGLARLAHTSPAAQVRLAAATSVPHPVLIVVFDGWSYARTFRDGQVRPQYPHLTELADSSTIYHQARSPGTLTVTSMPRILFGRSDAIVVEPRRVGFDVQGQFQSAGELPSLFSLPRTLGYRTIAVGTGLPYTAWLAGHVDTCVSFSYTTPPPDAPLERMFHHGLLAAGHGIDPLSRRMSEYDIQVQTPRRVYAGYRATLAAWPHLIRAEQPTFTFSHLLLPHAPYMFDASGALISDPASLPPADSIAGYERSLAQVDRVVGYLIAALRDAGRWDSSLIVLTADHGWHQEPDRQDDPLRHVPLIVKRPGQQCRIDIDAPFRTCELAGLINGLIAQPEPTLHRADRPCTPGVSTITRADDSPALAEGIHHE